VNNLELIAQQMLRLQDEALTAAPITASAPDFIIDDAYGVSVLMLNARQQQGWRSVGRKIGFTNRTIYEEYGVYEPIFGYMYDQTVTYLDTTKERHEVPLRGLSQPRMEPEIVFKLRETPPVTKDPVELLRAIEWMGHGVELVQCHFPDWKFAVADTIADGGLHGIYVVGPQTAIPESAGERRELTSALERFTARLLNNGELVSEGGGEVVLGSPLNALAHLIEVVGALPDHPRLTAGEIVTTGTLTAAMPVAAGETWSTEIEGLPLQGLRLRFT
jgi:2-oxo-3-hexenedioate decarboxylase